MVTSSVGNMLDHANEVATITVTVLVKGKTSSTGPPSPVTSPIPTQQLLCHRGQCGVGNGCWRRQAKAVPRSRPAAARSGRDRCDRGGERASARQPNRGLPSVLQGACGQSVGGGRFGKAAAVGGARQRRHSRHLRPRYLYGGLASWHRFPELLCGDARFKDIEVISVDYPTFMVRRNLRISELAGWLNDNLDSDSIWTRRNTVVIVAHSMGGLMSGTDT
jgi:hypothetical protein